jgi:Flp pilus assembly protein TadB
VTWSALLAVALTLSAVALWPSPAADARRRLNAVAAPPAAVSSRGRTMGGRQPPRLVREGAWRSALGRRACAGMAALGAAALVGGALGLVVGLAVGMGLEWGLRRLEPADVRRRRAAVRRALPGAADLLAACLTAGAPVETATAAVARAVGGPLGQDLDAVLRSVHLGSSPVQAWTAAALDPELAPLAVALARASRGGAPPAEVLGGAAEELRDRRRTEASMAAQRVGVHAVAPLALCFLPAFVLLGIVPLVLSLAQQLFHGSW